MTAMEVKGYIRTSDFAHIYPTFLLHHFPAHARLPPMPITTPQVLHILDAADTIRKRLYATREAAREADDRSAAGEEASVTLRTLLAMILDDPLPTEALLTLERERIHFTHVQGRNRRNNDYRARKRAARVRDAEGIQP